MELFGSTRRKTASLKAQTSPVKGMGLGHTPVQAIDWIALGILHNLTLIVACDPITAMNSLHLTRIQTEFLP